MPDELLAHRTPAEFARRALARIAQTTVACRVVADGSRADEVLGFVTVRGGEVEQLFVDAPCRGTGIASRLLAGAERQIGQNHDVAWLAVVAGNHRARRFYERCGWSDEGDFDNDAETSGGATMPVPARCYTKQLDRVAS